MKKNFGKFKQWTGERLGSAKTTGQTDDFHQLDQETEHRRLAFEKVYQAATEAMRQLDKKKPSPEDGKTKVPPNEALGACWASHGLTFPEDSLLGASLVNFGKTEIEISQLQQEFAYRVKESYISTLEKAHQDYKDYLALRKKLDSRRLDYDAKLNKLQKAKKEKPEWEQEVQASKMKYEETEYDVVQRMIYFQDSEEEHYNALSEVLEAQLDYHRSSTELLTALQQNWAQGYEPRSQESVPRPTLRTTLSRSSTASSTMRRDTTASNNSDDSYGDDGFQHRSPYANGRRPSIRQGSQDNLHPVARRQSSYSSTGRPEDSYGGRPAPPPVPRSKPTPSKKQVKAIYDFSGENANELNLYVGDVITVVEEIDDGWWMGELYDANGNKQQGLFPSNYVEEMSPPPMPVRPISGRSRSNSHYSQASDAAQDITEEPEEVESPFADSSSISNSYNQYMPPKPAMPRRGTVGSLHGTPISSPVIPRMPSTSQSTARPNIGSSRTPPPPPSSRTPSRSFTTGSHTAPPTPLGRTGNGYFNSQAASPQDQPPCADCGCDEFSPDVFKPKRCKTCFHYHG